jgi:hypothetical protein
MKHHDILNQINFNYLVVAEDCNATYQRPLENSMVSIHTLNIPALSFNGQLKTRQLTHDSISIRWFQV